MASHPQAPEDLLLHLADDPAPTVPQLVVENPNVSEAAIRQVARSGFYRNRQTVAALVTAPQDLLADLADDRDVEVRAAVAGNPSVDSDTLGVLALDDAWQVRENVSTNPLADGQALPHLADDIHQLIRANVASHPNTPDETLARLMEDPEPAVETAAHTEWQRRQEQTRQEQCACGNPAILRPPDAGHQRYHCDRCNLEWTLTVEGEPHYIDLTDPFFDPTYRDAPPESGISLY